MLRCNSITAPTITEQIMYLPMSISQLFKIYSLLTSVYLPVL